MGDIELTPEQLMAHPAVRSLVEGAVKEGIDAFRNAAPVTGSPVPGGAGATVSNVNLRRSKRLSIGRAVRAAVKGSWRGAELERDFTQATKEVFPFSATRGDDEEGNIFSWPSSPEAYLSVLEQGAFREVESDFQKHAQAAVRAMSEGSPTTSASGAGVLVPIEFLQDEFVLALTSAIVTQNLPGVETIPITDPVVSLPRESAAATATTAAEAGNLTASDPTFAQQVITAKKVYGYRQYSNELLADANPALNAYLARTLARDVALQKDLQFLTGSGSGANLTGIQNVSGLTTVSGLPATNGQNVSYDYLNQILWAIRRANAEANAMVMHPALGQAIGALKDANGLPLFKDGNLFSLGGAHLPVAGVGTTNFTYPGPAKGTVLNVPVYFSTQLSITETQGSASNATHLFVGDFRYCKILERQAVDIAVSPHILFTTDQTAMRAIWRGAIALTQPAAFAAIGGWLVS